MVDHAFADPDLAALYDELTAFDARGDFGFYLPLIMAADSVLDLGCGTGLLLHTARERGHTGRLVGLDPADGMLAEARKHPDVEWVQGYLEPGFFADEFDLVVMTGHAFQVFLTDAELRSALAAVREALRENGRFAFETRNPLARAWERWGLDRTSGEWRVVRELTGVTDDLVSFTTTFIGPTGPQVSKSTLRFLGTTELDAFLAETGLEVVERYGDWDASPLTDQSPEIISVVRSA